MKKEFAVTDNVKRFCAAVNGILQAPAGVDRMALIYGDPGLGKTETATWWVIHYGESAVYVRTKKLMSGRWLLEEVVAELGEQPAYRTSDLFRQAVDVLIGTNRVVILDEIDYLAYDARVIETIRDIHDITNSPFVFIGMAQADKKLKRYRHLWRRFSEVVRFDNLTREDTAAVIRQIAEVPVNDSAIEAIHGSGNLTVAMLYRWVQKMERIAKSRNLEQITADDLT
ncbi:MAG TPA: AAA family ATPase [Desulfobacterales bacterium]|nr:AAA family ATPase [Desulfobacterales bacterium]